ncbi:MAG TPA: alpha-amylase family glycosyl hydrolase [Polyangiaceae bacterium]|nr:alpha-amylase family glycosyl hydrolase [Polyangiaceae bacterium]
MTPSTSHAVGFMCFALLAAVSLQGACSAEEPVLRPFDGVPDRFDGGRDVSVPSDIATDVGNESGNHGGETSSLDATVDDRVEASTARDVTNDGTADARDTADGVSQDSDATATDSSSDALDSDASTASPCLTPFRYVPAPGMSPASVQVTGEWNGFANPGTPLRGPDAQGAFMGEVQVAPGLVAYKLIIDGRYELDPAARLRKYVGAVENSALRVFDCQAPALRLLTQSKTRSSPGQGDFQATVAFRKGRDAPSLGPASVAATLRHDGALSPLAATVDRTTETITVDAPALADGKYTIFVDAKDAAGHAAKTLRLVFWIEAGAFSWQDALIYMVMVDRFKNGDPSNDAPRTPAADERADFQGGDLQGVRNVIASGALDRLGVNTLWLSPFHSNPIGPYLAQDGVHLSTGYHGYWPTRARQVDGRIGGDAALKALVAEAHAHGMRVLQDFVVNHVHEEHEYVAQHPTWFRTGCVCGTANCDWTAHRLDCMFSDYLPDVDWTVAEASEQFGDDAVYWLDTFDLDGFRIDAVKHVEDACIVNLTARVRDEFEATGTRVFLTGETAMGWNGDSPSANQGEYDTINRYIGPSGLDGQFDFVLYHAAAYRTFAYDEKGLLHADFWAQESGRQYPKGAVMTPYIDSHDTPRSVTVATYRGQDGSHARAIATDNKWSNVAGPPTDAEPYQRHRLGLAWLFGLPGAINLYYGDEYGQWGGADPNNRAVWRGDQALTGEEATTLDFVRKLGVARRELVALRRGIYRPIYGTDDALLFARTANAGEIALIALSRLGTGTTIQATLPPTVGLVDGTTLRDRLGGSDVVVTGGAVSIALGARGAAILAP